MTAPSTSQPLEIELKFLTINPADVVTQLEALGAERRGKMKYRRQFFTNNGVTIRLREEHSGIVLCYKDRVSRKGGTIERELSTHDTFEKAEQFLLALGYAKREYVESYRDLWYLGDVMICIDEYPLIAPYLEIEAPSMLQVEDMARMLGFDPEIGEDIANSEVYRRQGIDRASFEFLGFDEQRKKTKKK